MDEFLRTKSMMTPAAAGMTTMMITAALSSNFGLPAKWVALSFSLLLGLTAWADKSVPFVQRLLFYCINSMTIFSIAVGGNTAGMALSEGIQADAARPLVERSVPPEPDREKSFFHKWL